MWNSSEITQRSDICTHIFWQRVSIILYVSLPYDRELSNEWVSSIFGTALVKVRAAKMHSQLPASGNLSVCSLSSSSGPPKWHCKTPLPLANTELRWDFFLPFCFLFVQKKPHKTKTPLPKCHVTLLELTSTYVFEIETGNLIWFLASLLQVEIPHYQLKAKPTYFCPKVHLYYYLLCRTLVLPQIGAIWYMQIVLVGQTWFFPFGMETNTLFIFFKWASEKML